MQGRKTGRRVSLWKCRGCGKRGKPKSRRPPLSTSPLEISPERRRDSHISTAPATRRKEKWKTKNRFPTFPPPRMYMEEHKNKNRAAGGLRPPPAGGRAAPPPTLTRNCV